MGELFIAEGLLRLQEDSSPWSYGVKILGSALDKVKIKVTLVQALRLCTHRTAHRGSRGIAPLFHDQRH